MNARRAARPTMDDMPYEILWTIAKATDSTSAAVRLGLTCRRHSGLLGDDSLWKAFCVSHFGPPLHEGFADAGKGWRWLYRAQAHAATAEGPDVGALMTPGRLYWGDTLDGLPHGYGLSLALPTPHRDGRALTRRKHDGPLGQAAPRHDGHWQCGKPYGRGVRVYRNGSRYEGDWRDGLHHGHGERRDSVGWRYVGTWRDDKQHGSGCLVLPGGHRYDGTWVDGIYRHWDTCVAWDGSVYSGWWHTPIASMPGSRGAWLANGTLTLPDGTVYVGEYDGDVVRGTATWTDGRRFEGTWHSWQMPAGLEGEGVMTYANGDVHSGGFRSGLCHGRGIAIRSTGLRIECDWDFGNASREVVITWPDGRRFEGALGTSLCDGEGQVTHLGALP
ncbi:F-box domain containing protein [Pandoravirus dulcis]|uniref:F-box domain containing protein n=1 Tax=Pandoravirus dulcis TaxID=1349409 RepID=S4VTF9_9VIRU|nr:F-box domain containing protein [Pandoravirus dulcis]AGO82705.2 F-box domain containing protein [Pandoravirus dulcis]